MSRDGRSRTVGQPCNRDLSFAARELDHRLKNVFPVVLAIVRLTGQHCSTVPEFQKALERRLGALSLAASLVGIGGTEVHFETLLKALLDPFLRDRQVTMSGPSVCLPAPKAESFALLLLELATNSLKYGALSTRKGRVFVRWTYCDVEEPAFRFEWSERDGPRVTTPGRKGFGSLILGADGCSVVGGTAAMRFDPEGFSYRLALPAWQRPRTDHLAVDAHEP